jgi:hypothetical protein
MPRYGQHGQGRSRGTGQGRYEQLRGANNGGLKAAVFILGALLIVSVVLTAVAWADRNNKVLAFNDVQKELDKAKNTVVQGTRQEHFKENVMMTGVTAGCLKCQQRLRDLRGAKVELRNAMALLTEKQKDELHFNYDIVAKNVTLNRVADPANANDDLIQITFTIKNQASEARGNMHGVFRLYKDEAMIWQKEFTPEDLAPGATTYVQMSAPGKYIWDGWGCQIYPSKTSE